MLTAEESEHPLVYVRLFLLHRHQKLKPQKGLVEKVRLSSEGGIGLRQREAPWESGNVEGRLTDW